MLKLDFKVVTALGLSVRNLLRRQFTCKFWKQDVIGYIFDSKQESIKVNK